MSRASHDKLGCHELIVSSIYEVATGVIVRVKELEGILLVHATHPEILPLVTNTHGT